MGLRFLYPGGKKKAFTLSYDDGILQDVRFVEMINRYHLKGTFNLNSSLQTRDYVWIYDHIAVARLNKEEIVPLLKGHECAIHTRTHPHLIQITREEMRREILDDRAALEELFGYPVRGMAYPYGEWNADVLAVLQQIKGIVYARDVLQTERFCIPDDFLLWHPTCYHNNPRLMELAKEFLHTDEELTLFYVWGHSYEFDHDENWNMMEQFCSFVSDQPDVWYATNIEIADYLLAIRMLSHTDSEIVNPSNLSIWVELYHTISEIKPHTSTALVEGEYV